MRTLSNYKGLLVNLRQAYRQTTNPEYKEELRKAAQFAVRRIEQIERRVLIKC